MTTTGHRPTRERWLGDAVGRTVLAAHTADIPLAGGSVDAVLATVVLCSVRSVAIGPHLAGLGVR